MRGWLALCLLFVVVLGVTMLYRGRVAMLNPEYEVEVPLVRDAYIYTNASGSYLHLVLITGRPIYVRYILLGVTSIDFTTFSTEFGQPHMRDLLISAALDYVEKGKAVKIGRLLNPGVYEFDLLLSKPRIECISETLDMKDENTVIDRPGRERPLSSYGRVVDVEPYLYNVNGLSSKVVFCLKNNPCDLVPFGGYRDVDLDVIENIIESAPDPSDARSIASKIKRYVMEYAEWLRDALMNGTVRVGWVNVFVYPPEAAREGIVYAYVHVHAEWYAVIKHVIEPGSERPGKVLKRCDYKLTVFVGPVVLVDEEKLQTEFYYERYPCYLITPDFMYIAIWYREGGPNGPDYILPAVVSVRAPNLVEST